MALLPSGRRYGTPRAREGPEKGRKKAPPYGARVGFIRRTPTRYVGWRLKSITKLKSWQKESRALSQRGFRWTGTSHPEPIVTYMTGQSYHPVVYARNPPLELILRAPHLKRYLRARPALAEHEVGYVLVLLRQVQGAHVRLEACLRLDSHAAVSRCLSFGPHDALFLYGPRFFPLSERGFRGTVSFAPTGRPGPRFSVAPSLSATGKMDGRPFLTVVVVSVALIVWCAVTIHVTACVVAAAVIVGVLSNLRRLRDCLVLVAQ